MLFDNERTDTRQVFFDAWCNYQHNKTLEGVEQIIVQVALQHPEYHAMLDDPDTHKHKDYLPKMGQTNPFLHLAMHVAIEEQISIDQPRGISDIYQKILQQTDDPHKIQHRMMECLVDMLWQIQRNDTAPGESVYFDCLKKLEIDGVG